jgi:hypothetical protein
VPLLKNFFEITFVEHENDQAMFYTLGRGRGGNVYVYGLKLKQFVFSNEIIDVGVVEIDDSARDYYPRQKVSLTTGSGKFLNDEIVYQGANVSVATAQALVHDFSPNTHVDIYRVKGTFASGQIKGNTSGAIWTINTIADKFDDAFEDIQDNNRIETEADGIIDFSETNPFGEP